MINRIFKSILIFSICIGISLPANAAVSVSDGSAFVTKAEISADLNNLSNRMAQLENSLDAKIDSLVSSYLTRNGIWNGAKQELIYTGVNQGLGWTASSNRKMFHQYFDIDYSYQIQLISDPFLVTQLGSSRNNVRCIDNLSKTGLLKLTYNLFRTSYTDSTVSDVLSIQPSVVSDNRRYSEQNFTIAQIYYYLHQDTWVNPSTSSLGVVYSDCTAFASVIPNIANYAQSIYTFVEKDKPLYISETLSARIPTDGASWKAIGVNSVKGSVLFKFEPISAAVY